MKILVMMPMYKTMNVSCVISLIDFMQDLYEDGHKVKFACTNGFNAAKARRALAKHAGEEEKDFDYVLWLDSDHVYLKKNFMQLIDRMEKEKLGMLSATYKLHGHSDTVHGITENGKFRHFSEEELKTDRVIDCQVVGFGFLVMKKKYMEELWEMYKEQLFVLDAKDNCTEDVKFCRCVLDKGDRVCFDPKVKVGHIESTVRY